MKSIYAFILGAILMIGASPAYATVLGWDLSGGVFKPLQNAWTSEVKVSYLTATSTTATSTLPVMTTGKAQISTLTSQNCLGTNSSGLIIAGVCGGTSTVYLASSTGYTIGGVAFATGNGTLSTVATGTLTTTATGTQLSATRALTGGPAIFSWSTGYDAVLAASTTQWKGFYDTPSSRITAGTGIDWSGNTLNGVYTAGDALTLTGEDFDFDGGATPAGELGGTWASPTIDDSLAVTSWNLTTPTLTSFFGTPCTGNTFLQDIGDTGTFTCAEAAGGGGGGGSLSTTTDIIGVPTNTPELVSYVTGDVMFGGSASTTAEFQFDDDGSKLIMSSSSANATGTILTNNNAQALRFGDDDGDMIEMYFGTAGDIILSALGTITDWVFNMNLYVQTGKNIFLGAVQWNSGDNIDGEVIANDTIDDDSIDLVDITLVDFTNDAGFITNDTSVDLTAHVTGILPQANGGTGTTTQLVWSRTVASTSIEFINASLMPLPIRLDGGTITRIVCKVDGGTSKIIAIEDASGNSSEDITCATTPTSDDGSITNATYTALEEMYIDFGATSGAVDHVSISVYK